MTGQHVVYLACTLVTAVPALAAERGACRKGELYVWHQNGGQGMSWPDLGTFSASRGFAIVDADPQFHDVKPGQLRVTTRSYHYHFVDPTGATKRRMHWHPEGQSPVTEPHIHQPPTLKKHWPMPRMSFETAVRWCLTEEVPPSCAESEADNRLTGSEAALKLFRSWQQTPTIRYGRPVSPR